MDEHEKDNELLISRRKLLRLAGLAGGAAVLGSFVNRTFSEPKPGVDNKPNEVAYPTVLPTEEIKPIARPTEDTSFEDRLNSQVDALRQSERFKQIEEEVIKAREKIGLNGTPPEFDLHNLQQLFFPDREKGESSLGRHIEMDPPEGFKGYGLRTAEIVQFLLGDRTTNFVSKVSFNGRDGLAYDRAGKIDIGKKPWEFNDTGTVEDRQFVFGIVHEVFHALDPKNESGVKAYTPEEYEEAVWYKYLILAKSRDYENLFLNKSDSYGVYQLNVRLGEEIAKGYLGFDGQKIDDTLGVNGTGVVNDWLNEFEIPIDNIKFNRKVCKKIGEKALLEMSKGKLKITPEFSDKINSMYGISERLDEVFPDMGGICVAFHEIVGRDRELSDLVTGWISLASRQKRNFFDLENNIDFASLEVLYAFRHDEEIRLKVQEAVESKTVIKKEPGQVVVSDELIKVFEEQRKFEEKVSKFYDGDQEYEDNGLTQYSVVVGAVSKRFSMLRNNSANDLDIRGSFDVNMHVWEIKKIEEAVDLDFVIQLMRADKLDDDQRQHIKKNTQVLLDFMNNPAYYDVGETIMVPGFRAFASI